MKTSIKAIIAITGYFSIVTPLAIYLNYFI